MADVYFCTSSLFSNCKLAYSYSELIFNKKNQCCYLPFAKCQPTCVYSSI